MDTSRNKRVALQIKNAPAATLGGAVARQYSGVAGIYLVPEVVSNSLLVSAPPEFVEEILKTLKTLDRAPLSVAVEVTIAEFSPAAGAAGQKPIRTADFNGPADKVRDALQELYRTGRIQSLKRFQMLAINNQTTSLQDHDDKAAAPAPVPAAPGAAPRAAQALPSATTVQLTARIVPDQGVVMELVVHDPPRLPASGGAASGAKEGERPNRNAHRYLGTILIPKGQTVVVSEVEKNTVAEHSQIAVIVSAKIVDGEVLKPEAE